MAKPRENLDDARRTWIFHVDDVVVDDYAPKIGVYGLAIYVLLARHAKENKSFPSYRLITKKLGIGRATVVRALAKLEEVRLITKEVRYTEVGDLDSNLYTLLDLSHHRIKGGSSVERLPSSVERLPSSSEMLPSSDETLGVVLQRDQGSIATELEGISLKGSQEKDLNTHPLPPQTGNGVCVREPDLVDTTAAGFTPYTTGFRDLCAVYPATRQEGTQEAYAIWLSRDLEPHAPDICAKVRLWVEGTWSTRETRYIPLMKTWLEKGRYNDVPPPVDPNEEAKQRLGKAGLQTMKNAQRILEDRNHGHDRRPLPRLLPRTRPHE